MEEEYGCANPQLSYLIVLIGGMLLSFLLGCGIVFVVMWLGGIICIGG